MAYYINGVTSTGLTLDDDWMQVCSGGTASKTTVLDNGAAYVSEGGVLIDTIVESCTTNGGVTILSGGKAFDTVLNKGGRGYLLEGAFASGVTVSSEASLSIGGGYTAEGGWELVGCGDFTGSGKDSVIISYAGQAFYTVDIDGVSSELTTTDAGWTIRGIGDFAGDGKDDIVAFHTGTGLVAMWGDGNAQGKWSLLGQMDANDWFVVGAGDYNNDQKDDLLVRQISTGMLGYYTSADMSQWNVLGYGVDMDWTVIA